MVKLCAPLYSETVLGGVFPHISSLNSDHIQMMYENLQLFRDWSSYQYICSMHQGTCMQRHGADRCNICNDKNGIYDTCYIVYVIKMQQ